MGKFEYFGSCVDRCESPIERLFLGALLFLYEGFEPLESPPIIARVPHTGVELAQQVQCDRHRIDFVLSKYGCDTRYAIELDGHAFHGKTADQFERDAIRQRILTDKGYTFLRFTGREIVRDPRKCALEAMKHATPLVGGAPRPSPAPVMKASIRPTTDGQLLELQAQLEAAEGAGDWSRQLRIAGAMRDRARALLDDDSERKAAQKVGDIIWGSPMEHT